MFALQKFLAPLISVMAQTQNDLVKYHMLTFSVSPIPPI